LNIGQRVQSKLEWEERDMRVRTSQFGAFAQSSIWMSVGAPMMVLLALISICGSFILLDFARDQDRAFADNSKVLVDRAIKERIKALATLTNDYSEWDAAYKAVTVAWDQTWVEENIYVTAVHSSLIYNRQRGIRYNYTSEIGKPFAAQSVEIGNSPEVKRLADDMLAQPFSSGNQGRATIIESKGALAIVFMSPFRPSGKVGNYPAEAPRNDVAIVVNYLASSELPAIAQSINIRDLRFSASRQSPSTSPETIAIPVKNFDGGIVGWLSWKHEIPGTLSLKQRGPLLLTGLAALFVLLFLASAGLVRSQLKVLDKARQTAEAASKSKSEFLSNMSHELRTPLNSVIGYAEIIQEDMALGDTLGATDDAARIKRSATHLLKLINDLLDHSKIEAGKMDVTPEEADLQTILHDVVDSLSSQAEANNVGLVVNCDPQIGRAMIDPIRFKQCLLNITSNAVKFTKDGVVTLAMRPVRLEGIDCFRVSVTDTGIGMNEDALQRIFKPFEQADGSTTRNFGGTGLGLSITKHLVEAMGGQVLVESQINKGSTFTIIMPINMIAENKTDHEGDSDRAAA
jgi:signal transduction histidine kinase